MNGSPSTYVSVSDSVDIEAEDARSAAEVLEWALNECGRPHAQNAQVSAWLQAMSHKLRRDATSAELRRELEIAQRSNPALTSLMRNAYVNAPDGVQSDDSGKNNPVSCGI